MQRLVNFITFTLGASLAASIGQAIQKGESPDPREALKSGIKLWDSMVAGAEAARTELDQFQARVRAQEEQARAKAARDQPARRIKVTVE